MPKSPRTLPITTLKLNNPRKHFQNNRAEAINTHICSFFSSLLGITVRLSSEPWHCACWDLVITQDLIQKGIVSALPGQELKTEAEMKAKPGNFFLSLVHLVFLSGFCIRW